MCEQQIVEPVILHEVIPGVGEGARTKAAPCADAFSSLLGGEGIEVREFDLPEAVHVDGVASSIDGLEGIEDRFTIESTPSPHGGVHMVFNRRPRD